MREVSNSNNSVLDELRGSGRTWPRISVVTPSFNQAAYLEQAIDSVLSQRYPDLEYIMIDGGSTDGSIDIIRRHEKQLAYWISEPDGGHYEGVNKGFARSTGEIMGWINSDDMYCPWALRTVASVMTALPEIEWLTTVRPLTWTCGGLCAGVNKIAGYSKRSLLDGCHLPNEQRFFGWIQQESTFWRRSLWERAGGVLRTQFRLAADFDLWARFYDHTDLYAVDSPLGGFRYQPEQRSRKVDEYLSEANTSLEEARRRNSWKQSWRALHLARSIPWLSRVAPRWPRYAGISVKPTDPERSDSGWRAVRFSFG
jgi:glycosyltransferase involved in cell wall biosynthesis